MTYGKLIDGKLEFLKSFIRVNGNDIFTSDEATIISNGYKPIQYTEPETREGYYPDGYSWVETDTEIVQKWEYMEVDNNEFNNQ